MRASKKIKNSQLDLMRMIMRMQASNQWLLSDAPALALRYAAKLGRYGIRPS
ncbi:hypothetical protein AU14_18850 [Marinobacter similis]|uniref:Uncharacterized protein n=1 Tax=Marinobacter similis TaxID=1420916 RepID=W5YUY7_9GAMM|nr:hypothetical protein AU14_18850 [Marinobacter similis]